MDKHLKNIKKLIDNNIVYERKSNILKERNKLNTYFNIGKEIVEAIGERSDYGKGLLKKYSANLTKEYGKGYDYTNLNRMRQLYLNFEKVGSLPQQLGWTHYNIILPIKEEGKRNYYINLAIKNTLSVRELKEAIKSKSYERLTKEDKENIRLIDKDASMSIIDMIKDQIIINCSNNKLDIRDLGQIEFFINYYDDEIRKEFHNETIRVIICKKNDKEVTKYNKNNNILVTSYKIK